MRNALVVGIGGTGKWVVTYLKHYIESAKEEGIKLPNTALLVFDLAGEEFPTAQISIIDNGAVGARKLDYDKESSKEFCLFGQSGWLDIAKNIANNPAGTNYPEFRAWWHPSDAALYNQTSVIEEGITIGAGQARQKSRAVFIESVKDSKIIEKLDSALKTASQALGTDKTLDIHIVWSVSGGTGCGSFIDTALLAQREARRILGGRNFSITGYIVLPKGYFSVLEVGNTGDKMEANCFAALRELERFMHFPETAVRYTSDPDLRQALAGGQARLFDLCYVIDGTRPKDSGALRLLDQDSAENDNKNVKGSGIRQGLFPGIADFLFHQIAYDLPPSHAQVLTEISEDLIKREPGTAAPLYGTFGTYSILFDVDALIGSFAQHLAGETIRRLKDKSYNVSSPNSVGEEMHNFINNTPGLVRTLLSYYNNTGQINLSSKEGLKGVFRFNNTADKPFPDIKIDDQLEGIQTNKFLKKVTADEVKQEIEDRMRIIGKSNDTIVKGSMPTFNAIFSWYKGEHHNIFAEALRTYIHDQILVANFGWGSLAHAEAFLETLVGKDGNAGFFSEVRARLENDFKNRYLIPKDKFEEANKKKTEAEEAMNKRPLSGDLQKQYVPVSQIVANYTVIRLGFEYLLDTIDLCANTCWSLLKDVRLWLDTFYVAEMAHNELELAWLKIRSDWRNIKLHKYVTEPGDELELRLYGISTGKIESKGLNKYEQISEGYISKVNIDNVMQQFTWRYDEWEDHSKHLVCCLPAEYVPPTDLKSDAKKWNLIFVDKLLKEGYFASLKKLTASDMVILYLSQKIESINEMALAIGQEIKKESSYLSSPKGNGNNASSVVYIPPANIDTGFHISVAKFIDAQQHDSVSPYSLMMQQCNHRLKILDFQGMRDVEDTYRRKTFDKINLTTIFPPLSNFLEERLASIVEAHFDLIGEESSCIDLSVIKELANCDVLLAFSRLLIYGQLIKKADAKTRTYQYYWKDAPLGRGILDALRNLSNTDNQDTLQKIKNSLDEYEQSFLDNECHSNLQEMAEKIEEYINNCQELNINHDNKTAEEDIKRVIKIVLLLLANDNRHSDREKKYMDVLLLKTN